MFENLPKNHFRVIYADPPWNYKCWSKKGESRGAQAHYDCMSLTDIKNMPVSELAADDCVILMWVTDPFLEKGIELLKAWGFEYKTVGFHWMKLRKGLNNQPSLFIDPKADVFMGGGYYTRANNEICLLGTKGKPKRVSKAVRRAILSPVREHSRKPDEIYGRIEKLLDGPYLELFARNQRNDWHSWGNQTNKFEEVA